MAINQISIQDERLRRQEIIARQQAEDEEYDYDDQEGDDVGVEQQTEVQRKAEEEDNRTGFLLHALGVRRKHIAEAEQYVAKEKETKPTLWGYKFVFVLAICKDLIDLSIVATIPGIGFIITSMFWIAMFIALYLAKTNRSLFEIKKIATLVVGFILEAFGFLLATLPMQTIVAVVIFLIDKAESNEKIMKAIQLVENIADIKHKK